MPFDLTHDCFVFKLGEYFAPCGCHAGTGFKAALFMITFLDSPRILLDRAQRHTEELEFQTQIYARTARHHLFQETDLRTGKIYIKATTETPPPLNFAAIVFDAVNCLRSTLDYSVISAVNYLTGDEDPKAVKFPFGDKTEKSFLGEFKGKASGIPADLRHYFTFLQPYENGNRLLWGLNKIRNSKIHKMLSPMVVGAGSTSLNPEGYISSMNLINRWDREKNEATVMEIGPGSKVTLDAKFDLVPAFSEDTPFVGEPAIGMLKLFHQTVREIIAGIEADASRIKRGALV